jgi:hypothetical protein
MSELNAIETLSLKPKGRCRLPRDFRGAEGRGKNLIARREYRLIPLYLEEEVSGKQMRPTSSWRRT